MRMILGLDVPTSGTTKVNGQSYWDLPAPLTEIGALLDAGATASWPVARDHLEAMALTHGIGVKRVEQVIEMVGLDEVANRRAKTFSLGMASGWGSRRRSWATRERWCSMSRSTVWTRRASAGFGRC